MSPRPAPQLSSRRPLRGLASLLGQRGGDVPRQQLVDAVDWMLGDPLEHMAQVEIGIHPIEQRRTDQAIDVSGALAPGIGAGKQVVASAEDQRSDRTLSAIVVDLDATVVAIAGQ